VGDIVNVKYGSQLFVDGILIQSQQLAMDEAAITGEQDEMRKESVQRCLEVQAEGQGFGNDPSPILLSGSSVTMGEGKMLVLTVGESTIKASIDLGSE
jgi:magnesium-transporting ATPase (P-type)